MKIKHDSEGPRTVHECEDCKPQTHTPTPWIVKGLHPNYGGHVLMKDTGHGLARIDDKSGNFSDANAAFIVRAVNAHDGLIETLKAEHRTNIEYDDRHDFDDCLVCSLIAKAEGK